MGSSSHCTAIEPFPTLLLRYPCYLDLRQACLSAGKSSSSNPSLQEAGFCNYSSCAKVAVLPGYKK